MDAVSRSYMMGREDGLYNSTIPSDTFPAAKKFLGVLLVSYLDVEDENWNTCTAGQNLKRLN